MCALSLLLYKLNYSNCFKLFSSVLLSRSLIIPGWSPLASFDTGPRFFWNAVQKMKHSVLAETEHSMQHWGKWKNYFISYKLYCSLHASVTCTSFFSTYLKTIPPTSQGNSGLALQYIKQGKKLLNQDTLCSKRSWPLNRSQAEHKTSVLCGAIIHKCVLHPSHYWEHRAAANPEEAPSGFLLFNLV